LSRDSDNVYVVLTARQLNAGLLIVARAEDERSEPKLMQAGATRVVSPYVIGSNDRIARLLLRPFERRSGPETSPSKPAAEPASQHAADIVLLGHFRIAQAVLDLVEGQLPDMKGRITLVDYDANRAHAVMARGFRWEYGDLANPDALEHLGIEEARVVVTTISDTFLKGISTRRLVENLRRLAPRALIVMTGEEKSDAVDLLRAGADHVLIPGEITGERIVQLLTDGKPPAAS